MKILFYSSKKFEIPYLASANKELYHVEFLSLPLSADTAHLSKGYDCVSIFTADDASTEVIEKLNDNGVRFIAIRAAGHDNVDVRRCNEVGIRVANVPAYSPYAIAEFAVGMMLTMNRQLIRANSQVSTYNFTLDRLVGFDFHQKTVGIIGTGKIGAIVAKIMHGFGCRLLAYDVVQSTELCDKYDVEYTDLGTLCRKSDIITLHAPLNKKTKYLIDESALNAMKTGVMIVNTSRGGLVDTAAIINALENGKVGYLGMDVYEKERGLFFFDHSGKQLNDPMLEKLIAMPNVLVTPHQAFATQEALTNIADTTFYNINCWAVDRASENELQRRASLMSL